MATSAMNERLLASAKKLVVRSDPDTDPDSSLMEFRLTYAGPLLAASQSDPRTDHKHEIRKTLHPQLRRLWEITPWLSQMREPWAGAAEPEPGPVGGHRFDVLADRYRRNGYRFVPLVTSDLLLSCGVEILVLRPDPPGKIVQSGDIDNRLKTLFDALRMPRHGQEL